MRTFPNLKRLIIWMVLILIPFGICQAEEKRDGTHNLKYIFKMVKKYFPADYYKLLQKTDQQQMKRFVDDITEPEALLMIPVIFHETVHFVAAGRSGWQFPVEPGQKIPVGYYRVFPALEIDQSAPPEVKNLTRYPVYVTSPDFREANNTGIYWYLDEMNAYNYSVRTYLMLYDVINGEYGFDRPEIWVDYLRNFSSNRYAVGEFKIFIGLYLQTAQKAYPQIYQMFINDQAIKKLFTYIEHDDAKHMQAYDEMIQKLQTNLDTKVDFIGDFVGLAVAADAKSRTGYGLGHELLKEVQDILQKDEYQILNELRL